MKLGKGVLAGGPAVLVVGLVTLGVSAGFGNFAGTVTRTVLSVIGAPLTGVGAALKGKQQTTHV